MYNTGKIITGLIIFVVIFAYPLYSNIGKAAPQPKPELPPKTVATKCLAPTEYMRTSHMQMLDTWRNDVVRSGLRVYLAENGKAYNMSLQNTCMECHKDKAKFCDTCHNYAGVSPYCWTCHLPPKENK